MPAIAKKEVSDLSAQASEFAANHGQDVVLQLQVESALMLEWLGYLTFAQRTGVANSLLTGAASSIRESAACLALGLVRPALFALRTQIDLVLAWLYFKDHPVEWKTVNDYGEGYKLKREILDWLNDHHKGFNARVNVLTEVAQRNTDDPYRLLSAHVHAQSGPALPAAAELKEVVSTQTLCVECTVMAREVGEYLGDILAAVYASKWAALPAGIRGNIEMRLALKKGAAERFFKGL